MFDIVSVPINFNSRFPCFVCPVFDGVFRAHPPVLHNMVREIGTPARRLSVHAARPRDLIRLVRLVAVRG